MSAGIGITGRETGLERAIRVAILVVLAMILATALTRILDREGAPIVQTPAATAQADLGPGITAADRVAGRTDATAEPGRMGSVRAGKPGVSPGAS